MPVIEAEGIIRTKIIGTMDQNRQSILLEMYQRPENVIELSVENDIVTVLLEMNGSPVKAILGTVKEKYMPWLQNKTTRIKQYYITGGGRLEGYGSRCMPFGINLTIQL
jgi:hypothetical protein